MRRPGKLVLGLLGCLLALGTWYLAVDVLALPRFSSLPALADVFGEWTSRDPAYGTSFFTHQYYADIWISLRRVLEAFALAVVLGVPLGVWIGWSQRFRELAFPVLELIRPIPILAWVPLAILMFPRGEQPVIFLTFLSAFFVMTLNTVLGVQSVDRDLVRAARCLGASSRDVLRTVVVPAALPYVTTGMKVAIGVSWFSLVAGEMVAGQSGLGYLINSSYATLRYPTIVIGMLTLGLVGFASSALVGAAAERLAPHRSEAVAA
jgi:NitT/TauT family transport system permease protein